MLRYVMLGYAMLCCAAFRYATLRYASYVMLAKRVQPATKGMCVHNLEGMFKC